MLRQSGASGVRIRRTRVPACSGTAAHGGSATSISVLSRELPTIPDRFVRSARLTRASNTAASTSRRKSRALLVTAVLSVVTHSSRADLSIATHPARTDLSIVMHPARTDDATQLAGLFADCSGIWQAVSIMEARIGKDISARRYASLSQAARESAGYILAADRGAEGNVRRATGWDGYVRPRANAARAEMLLLIDAQDGPRVDDRMQACAATLQTQSEIVQLIHAGRDESRGD
jgi:hypothetical protein